MVQPPVPSKSALSLSLPPLLIGNDHCSSEDFLYSLHIEDESQRKINKEIDYLTRAQALIIALSYDQIMRRLSL